MGLHPSKPIVSQNAFNTPDLGGTSKLSPTHLKHNQSKISKKTTVATQHTVECRCLALVIVWLIGRVVGQHHESIIPQTASPGKHQKSKFEEQFLLNVHYFCTIGKSKICGVD